MSPYQNNFNNSLAGKRTLALTGPTFGLSLVLNLNQKYYLRKGGTQKVCFHLLKTYVQNQIIQLYDELKIIIFRILNQGGARVTVHDTELRPLVDEDGQDVTPSQITSIAVKEVIFCCIRVILKVNN